MSSHTVAMTGFGAGAHKVWAARLVRDYVGLDMKNAKSMIDVALAGGQVHLEVPTVEEANELSARLLDLGFETSVE